MKALSLLGRRFAGRTVAVVLLAVATACGPDSSGTEDEDASDNLYAEDIATCLPACEANKCLLAPEDEGCAGACVDFADAVDVVNPTECDSAKVVSFRCMLDAFLPDPNEDPSCSPFEQARMSATGVELCQAERDEEASACS